MNADKIRLIRNEHGLVIRAVALNSAAPEEECALPPVVSAAFQQQGYQMGDVTLRFSAQRVEFGEAVEFANG